MGLTAGASVSGFFAAVVEAVLLDAAVDTIVDDEGAALVSAEPGPDTAALALLLEDAGTDSP
jgi:hypothetical protein